MDYEDAIEEYGIEFADMILKEEYNQLRGNYNKYMKNIYIASILKSFDDLDDVTYEELCGMEKEF